MIIVQVRLQLENWNLLLHSAHNLYFFLLLLNCINLIYHKSFLTSDFGSVFEFILHPLLLLFVPCKTANKKLYKHDPPRCIEC